MRRLGGMQSLFISFLWVPLDSRRCGSGVMLNTVKIACNHYRQWLLICFMLQQSQQESDYCPAVTTAVTTVLDITTPTVLVAALTTSCGNSCDSLSVMHDVQATPRSRLFPQCSPNAAGDPYAPWGCHGACSQLAFHLQC